MKISVITPSFNQCDFIDKTIHSVLSQQLDIDIEMLVIDGGSTDGTIEILKKYGDRIKWFSESDQGQADAVNKGIAMASGEIIGWLNSDDLYLPGSLKLVADYFNDNPDSKWVYGKCRIINEHEQEIWKTITRYKNISLHKFSLSRLMTENYISQPAVFFRKELFEETGPLDLNLNYALDYDLWLKFAKKYPAGVIHKYLSAFRRHNTSKSETNFKEQFSEQYRVAKRNGASRNQLLLHKFNINKIIYAYRVINFFTK